MVPTVIILLLLGFLFLKPLRWCIVGLGMGGLLYAAGPMLNAEIPMHIIILTGLVGFVGGIWAEVPSFIPGGKK